MKSNWEYRPIIVFLFPILGPGGIQVYKLENVYTIFASTFDVFYMSWYHTRDDVTQ